MPSLEDRLATAHFGVNRRRKVLRVPWGPATIHILVPGTQKEEAVEMKMWRQPYNRFDYQIGHSEAANAVMVAINPWGD